MIDWAYLSKKFKKNVLSDKFEELALKYVEDIYPQYTWVPTKSVADNNRDAHLGKGTEFDVWEEAKYKGKNYKIRRQDLDTTILSGIIQGNVRLIIFVSNALIPEHLYNRANICAKMKGIEITYALNAQLEDWVINHRDVFKNIFDEDIIESKICQTYRIEQICLYNTSATEFNALSFNKEMIIGERYIMSIRIFSSTKCSAELMNYDEFPFKIIEGPGFDCKSDISLHTGINTINFLVQAYREHNNCVSVGMKINEKPYFITTGNILLVPNNDFPFVYSSQLDIINKVYNLINKYTNNSAHFLITLYAESGTGKSFLLNKIYLDFLFKREVVLIDFERAEYNNANYVLLCKIILYLNFGNVFLYIDLDDKNSKSFLMEALCSKKLYNDLSKEDICNLVSGCFDIDTSISVINNLVKECNRKNKIIVPIKNKINRILLLDDVQYLNSSQYDLIKIICNQIEIVNSNITLLMSATVGKFKSKMDEKEFNKLAINKFSLKGLSQEDKLLSAQNVFSEINDIDVEIIDKIIPDNVLLASEIFMHLTQEIYSNNILDIITSYNNSVSGNAIFQNKFSLLNDQFYLLDIIYIFKLGININILSDYFLNKSFNINNDLNTLEKLRLINIKNEIVRPYHDYCITSYKKLRQDAIYNNNTADFLQYLLQTEIDIDKNLILSTIIKCGEKYFIENKKEINEIILTNVHNTNFGTALYYCEYYYVNLKSKETQEYSSGDWYYLYLYADCLVHCGKSSDAEIIFDYIVKNTKSSSIEHIEAGVSLLNQFFWHMKLKNIIGNSVLLQYAANNILKSDIDSENKIRMEKAIDSCHNRRMVTQLLTGNYKEARITYITRLKDIVKTFGRSKFCNISATLIMDYARGISYKTPLIASDLMKVALSYYSQNTIIQYRRAILCQIDSLVLNCITDGLFDSDLFEENINNLKNERFYSEYFKANLKYWACKLIQESKILSKSGYENYQSSSEDDAYTNIHRVIIDINWIPEFRDKYLYNILLAYIYIKRNEKEQAKSCLLEAKQFISCADHSYIASIEHNLKHINEINRIEWNFNDKKFLNNCYYLDCRFW